MPTARPGRWLAVAPLALLVAADRPAGYLGGATIDITEVVSPPPVPGDLRYEMDRAVFRATRRLVGTPRWTAAIRDVDYTTPAMERDFACATDLALSPERFPALTRLLNNSSADSGRANEAAKAKWRHLRPFLIDAGDTCENQQEISRSYDYPSGHTTKGWTFGLVLADVMPDRLTPVLQRARAYGESRIVCRVHNFSAVENGRLGAAVSLAAIRQTPGYLADLTAARAEVAAARHASAAPELRSCSREDAVLVPSVLAGLDR